MNRRIRLARIKPLRSTVPLQSRTPLGRTAPLEARSGQGRKAATRRSVPRSGRAKPFPPAVAGLLDARDPWCVNCGSPQDLERHHRRGKGQGGDPRPHTQCACNGVRLCHRCHMAAHRDERTAAEHDGYVISRSVTEPWAESVLVHTADGGVRKYPACGGTWQDWPQAVAA